MAVAVASAYEMLSRLQAEKHTGPTRWELRPYRLRPPLEDVLDTRGPAMVDHLELIPGQVVQIVKDDPRVLDSFESFIDAMVGPK